VAQSGRVRIKADARCGAIRATDAIENWFDAERPEDEP
jgi:hypothetical protein